MGDGGRRGRLCAGFAFKTKSETFETGVYETHVVCVGVSVVGRSLSNPSTRPRKGNKRRCNFLGVGGGGV